MEREGLDDTSSAEDWVEQYLTKHSDLLGYWKKQQQHSIVGVAIFVGRLKEGERTNSHSMFQLFNT